MGLISKLKILGNVPFDKPQPAVSGETGLLDSINLLLGSMRFVIIVLKHADNIKNERELNGERLVCAWVEAGRLMN